VRIVKSSDFLGACGRVVDRVSGGTLRHGNQPALETSVANARACSHGIANQVRLLPISRHRPLPQPPMPCPA
jgi:hypothetical protein